jgi:hypothetical protein
MQPAYDLEGIRTVLERAFEARYPASVADPVRMVGILFAPAGSAISRNEILPRLDDFHHRSGSNIDFFCAGYGAYWPPDWVQDARVVATTTYPSGATCEWQYSAQHFNRLLSEVHEYTPQLKYSGEVDLLLVNARRDSFGLVDLDFSNVVVLMISRMKADKIIDSAPELFERIFEYAESADSPVTVEGFSDASGKLLARSWLDDLLSILPGKAGALWKKGRHFAVQDLSRKRV